MKRKHSDQFQVRKDIRTEREKKYEKEIQELRAKVEYYESLEEYKPFVPEKKRNQRKDQSK